MVMKITIRKIKLSLYHNKPGTKDNISVAQYPYNPVSALSYPYNTINVE
jgi:hypothetical protein